MKKTIVIVVACLFLLPLAPQAAQKITDRLPPQAAIDACVGKSVGYVVRLPDKSGKIVLATCKEVNGQLIAVPKVQRRRLRKSEQGDKGSD